MAINPTEFLVQADELPNIRFTFPDLQLSTSFASLQMVVRRSDGAEITKNAIIDDDLKGIFHFEWAPGDLIPGVHEMELRTQDINTLKIMTIPSEKPLRLVVRERV